MSNKTILILGASSDLAEALIYSETKNVDYILAARNSKRLLPLQSDLQTRFHLNIEIKELDVLNFESHQSFVDSIENTIDEVYSVVGFLGDQPEAEENFDEARKIVNSNFTGVISLLELISKKMIQQKSGCIIGISSVAGERGRQSNYFYGSAKAGFTTYLSGLRNRLSKFNIHVLTVKPGFILTNMTKDLDLPPLLTASSMEVAKDIKKAIRKKKNIIYSKWFWRYIMLIIRLIPENIFKKLSL